MLLTAALDGLPREAQSPEDKLRQTLALHDAGVVLQRMKLRRSNVDATEERIDELLRHWLAREAPFESP